MDYACIKGGKVKNKIVIEDGTPDDDPLFDNLKKAFGYDGLVKIEKDVFVNMGYLYDEKSGFSEDPAVVAARQSAAADAQAKRDNQAKLQPAEIDKLSLDPAVKAALKAIVDLTDMKA